jgi:nitroreductase
MDVIEAIHSRRSIRTYDVRPVARELVESVIWDAAQAPPPFAGQLPWAFNVFEGVERIASYGARARQYARDHRPPGADWHWVDDPDFEIFWDAPVIVIVSGRTEDCCRAGQNLMLSAHARGLGTCWVGSPMLWLRDETTRAELGIPAGFEPVSVFCLGYPKQILPRQARAKPLVIWGV